MVVLIRDGIFKGILQRNVFFNKFHSVREGPIGTKPTPEPMMTQGITSYMFSIWGGGY